MDEHIIPGNLRAYNRMSLRTSFHWAKLPRPTLGWLALYVMLLAHEAPPGDGFIGANHLPRDASFGPIHSSISGPTLVVSTYTGLDRAANQEFLNAFVQRSPINVQGFFDALNRLIDILISVGEAHDQAGHQ